MDNWLHNKIYIPILEVNFRKIFIFFEFLCWKKYFFRKFFAEFFSDFPDFLTKTILDFFEKFFAIFRYFAKKNFILFEKIFFNLTLKVKGQIRFGM